MLSESSLDLLPVKSDMAEVISRQDWTARISEERASSRNEISARLPEVDLGTHLLDRILRRLLVFLDVLLWQQRQISDITSGLDSSNPASDIVE